MKMERVVLDTDILSAIMKKNPLVQPKARAYLAEHHKFTFSILTRYEILRGLKAKNATKQEKAFNLLCSKNLIPPLTEKAIVKASEIYAELRSRGELIGDADILIAASALVNQLSVVTNNTDHFTRISDLTVRNWL